MVVIGAMASEDWEREAENWIAWTRTPGHDANHLYRDAFFDLLPAPGAARLEVGCGEGRVARDLAARGHRVTGIDAAPTLIRPRSSLILRVSTWWLTLLSFRSPIGRSISWSPTTR